MTDLPDRLPPNDNTAEKAALGCVLLGWQTAMPVCIERIASKIDFFYDIRHQDIYRIMVQMYDAQEAIDMVTLSSWLSFQSLLEKVGGLTYLESLEQATPSAANLTYYLDILEDKFKSRCLIRICAEYVSDAYNTTEAPDELIGRAASDILALAESSAPKDTEASMQHLMPGALDQIEKWHSEQGVLTGIATGFADLDAMTTGLHPGEMIVIAGRPGIGKSSLAMNIADHVAVEQGLAVGVFSMEMTKEALAVRLVCSRAHVNVRSIRQGFLSHDAMSKIAAAVNRIHVTDIYINDESSLSILALRTRARRMHQQHGIRLLVIDYLQLMSAERSRNDNREQEVSFISRGVKTLAKELNIPVIALSQLNRTIERDKERRPRLSDLRESGAIENDADFVGILWRPYSEDRVEQDAIAVNLEICKQRNGPCGPVPLTFLPAYTRFESAAKVSDGDPGYTAPYPDHQIEAQQEFPT